MVGVFGWFVWLIGWLCLVVLGCCGGVGAAATTVGGAGGRSISVLVKDITRAKDAHCVAKVTPSLSHSNTSTS